MVNLSNNKKFIMYIMATALMVYGLSILPSFFAAIIYKETAPMRTLIIISLISFTIGIFGRRSLKGNITTVSSRINYITTLITWFMIIALSATVLFLSLKSFSVVDSIFDATASLSGTGTSTVDVSTLPYSLQLFRSTCSWLGGIGIILCVVTLLPKWAYTNHGLAITEIPGSDFLKTSISLNKTYKGILQIYIALTLAQFVFLRMAGMDFFQSLLTTLSNTSTSGVQHLNCGVITGLDTDIKIILTIFSFFGSINASFFLLVFTHNSHMIGKRSEIKAYVVRILGTTIIISLFISIANKTLFTVEFGNALMQTVSFLSTSGYVVTDCYSWPAVCQVVILLQMFIGACSVSTGGGIKTARAEIALKSVGLSLFKHVHPKGIKPISFNKGPLKTDQLIRANLYIAVFMFTYIACALLLAISDKSTSIFGALNYSQAMLTGTGTSIAELQTPGLVSTFSDFSKIVMAIEMLAGRLEIYPLLMILFRGFWKRTSTY